DLTDTEALGDLTAKALAVIAAFPEASLPNHKGRVVFNYIQGTATRFVTLTSYAAIPPLVTRHLAGAALMEALGYRP
ncbi:MAG TPA: hypothetical protein VMT34_10455, partial [Aggregatilineales bacterium]|nr:hypothetical protein [Aggregatilineales bacterium]